MGFRFGQPALAVGFADLVAGIEPVYVDADVSGDDRRAELVVTFRDQTYALAIELHYRIYDDANVLDRWVVLRNESPNQIDVRTAFSAVWTLPFRADYQLSHLHGRWGGETQLDRVRLPTGEMTLGARHGGTSHVANPWFALDDGSATEERGEVWSGALAWSGSWRFVVERLPNGRAQVAGGFAGQDGVGLWRLAPDERLTTPVFSGLYSAGGFGSASRAWHAYQLSHVLPQSEKVRPVLYNSWFTTHFDVYEQNQRDLARSAAELGVELFVVDDGWFGKRRNDRAGLGDWYPAPERFPNGLKPLIDEVHELGMEFGLWVEPEMVNPDSDLYHAHPDWVYHYPTRPRHQRRNQLVLNFARPDVAAWAYEMLDTLLTENAIDYLKWDMNRPISQPGWPEEQDNPQRLWVDHVRNLYDILDRLRSAHPGVAFESCAGGGGRIDLGILGRMEVMWPSDNTDPVDRLSIHHGFTQAYAPGVMSAWVTDAPADGGGRQHSLRYAFHVAMAGLLGIGANIADWTERERTEAADLIATYKRIRPIIQLGFLYRLRPPTSGNVSAVSYVTRDGSEVVVIAWLHAHQFGGAAEPPLRLRGLDSAATYRDVDTGERWSGRLLVNHGIPVTLEGDADSMLVHLVSDAPSGTVSQR